MQPVPAPADSAAPSAVIEDGEFAGSPAAFALPRRGVGGALHGRLAASADSLRGPLRRVGPPKMAGSGDWVVPHLSYVPYFEKPILTYWLEAASQLAFGAGMIAVRVPSILACVAMTATTYLLGKRLRGARSDSARRRSSPGPVMFSRAWAPRMTTDPPLLGAARGLLVRRSGGTIARRPRARGSGLLDVTRSRVHDRRTARRRARRLDGRRVPAPRRTFPRRAEDALLSAGALIVRRDQPAVGRGSCGRATRGSRVLLHPREPPRGDERRDQPPRCRRGTTSRSSRGPLPARRLSARGAIARRRGPNVAPAVRATHRSQGRRRRSTRAVSPRVHGLPPFLLLSGPRRSSTYILPLFPRSRLLAAAYVADRLAKPTWALRC